MLQILQFVAEEGSSRPINHLINSFKIRSQAAKSRERDRKKIRGNPKALLHDSTQPSSISSEALQRRHVGFCSNASKGKPRLSDKAINEKKELDPTGLKNALMHAINILSVVNTPTEYSRQKEYQLIHYRGSVLKMLQAQLSTFSVQRFQSTIAGIASLTIFEVCSLSSFGLAC